MKDKLIIGLIQENLFWENKEKNISLFSKIINDHTTNNKPDVVILPEMFTTGFSMNPSSLAEKMTGPTVNWMKKVAIEKDILIGGSIPIVQNKKYYNRFIWAFPNGNIQFYDKSQLFTYAKEHLQYSFGQDKTIINFKGWRICGLICYDLRFPLLSRNRNTYDLLIYVANFPEKRRFAWKHLLIARAIENQSYTIGVNRLGLDGHQLSYVGDSTFINYDGATLLRAKNKRGYFQLQLDLENQNQFRNQFQFLKDIKQ